MVPLTSYDGDDGLACGVLPPDVAEHGLWGTLTVAAAQRATTAVSLDNLPSDNR